MIVASDYRHLQLNDSDLFLMFYKSLGYELFLWLWEKNFKNTA